MNRRQYLRVAAGLPFAALTAGCTGRDASDALTETVVVNVGEGGGGGAAEPPVTETDASTLEIDATELERIGQNQYIVTGAVRNNGEEAFSHVELDVQLFQDGGGEEGVFSQIEAQREFEYLSAGETWRFRLRFEEEGIDDPSHFSVSATAWLATPTPTP